MEIFNNHKKLFTTATVLFLLLTVVIAIVPAFDNQMNNGPLPDAQPLSENARKGRDLYISNGCVACHSQQVRNVHMDKVWGNRPSIAADYALSTRVDTWRNTATLMGTERTGPDLTDVGNRQPSLDWHLLHLYNPRLVVKESIMPAYPWLFTHKEVLEEGDIAVNVPLAMRKGNKRVVATQEALYLVAYLQELKQAPLPETTTTPSFLYKPEEKVGGTVSKMDDGLLDGQTLYAANCQSCHQASGEGLAGAFPPLKNSKIVLSNDLKLYVDIIMNGYDSRPEYSAMPAVGNNMGWTEKEVTAIINYERNSWGNKAPKVSEEEVKEVMEYLKTQMK
ncbi:cbb3-type cytochrome c oxidase subunit II [Sphingobacterium faecale]|uniref:Cytochrome c n=1 Tax=Sphingobacterium faecale TaxID=2803775 RepID=A0ABS1QYV1_9SPHI|nr:cbb3-type cytochrome c oxidase subunit II [Sphingobacterium faecale]MBL1407370.1 cytochrome c [Sphingobacterium faecale]